ncbi:MAG: nicotinamide-nucleotide amidohydrolase family protein, partial [Planctomycetes bacterium]|nr:nicotinamide-nucleotide amidohydrolase family protein [Planctomycetota bacterium]
SQGIITVRIVAHGDTKVQADRVTDADTTEVQSRLGSVVFGEGETTLAEAVAELLVRQCKTVATAESCTGGLLAKQLTDVPGSSGYFLRGYITYSNEAKISQLSVPSDLIKRDGAVSESVARAMAVGCRDAAGTDIALSATGIAGPTGGDSPEKPIGLVYLGLADAEGVVVRRVLFGEHLAREEIRDRASKTGLNLLRRHLLGHSRE